MKIDSPNDVDSDFDYLFKIVMIGDAGVGKSAIVHRFKYNTFVERHASTIGVDFLLKTITIDGKRIKVLSQPFTTDWSFIHILIFGLNQSEYPLPLLLYLEPIAYWA